MFPDEHILNPSHQLCRQNRRAKNLSNTNCITNFLEFIEEKRKQLLNRPGTEDSNLHLFFRGHSKSTYKLEPTVFRKQGHKKNEQVLLDNFIAKAPKLFTNSSSTIERLVRAQHYEIPTRLLDFTTNPLMSLFFACKSHPDVDGEVVMVGLSQRSIKYSTSDTISCIANLSKLNSGERKEIFDFCTRILDIHGKASRTPQIVDEFKQLPSVKRLIQFIKMEKPYFDPRIIPADLIYPSALHPEKGNDRISAQSGTFMVFGTSECLERSQMADYRFNYKVESGKKTETLRLLKLLGVDNYKAFPEPEKVAKEIAARYV